MTKLLKAIILTLAVIINLALLAVVLPLALIFNYKNIMHVLDGGKRSIGRIVGEATYQFKNL